MRPLRGLQETRVATRAGLEKKKAAALRDLWNVQISRMEMEANKEALQNSLDELRHQRDSILAQKNAFIQEWRNNISEELVKLRRDCDPMDCSSPGSSFTGS